MSRPAPQPQGAEHLCSGPMGGRVVALGEGRRRDPQGGKTTDGRHYVVRRNALCHQPRLAHRSTSTQLDEAF